MENFWDFSVWGSLNLFTVLLLSILVANALKKSIPLLQASLIPTSVIGGAILLIVASVYEPIFGVPLFNTAFFGGKGYSTLEMLTYHTLALGFIASTFKSSDGKLSKERTVEIFNTGVTTVSTYLLQAILGITVSIVAALLLADFFPAAGVLLPFGFGQGTGQAMNYGNIYETQFGFAGGKAFGLTIAALGFLSAAIGGVIYLNIHKNRIKRARSEDEGALRSEQIQDNNEIPMQASIDKITIQVALVVAAYLIAYLLMTVLGMVLPGMKAVIFGFNFLLGVLAATLMKAVLNLLNRKQIIKKHYVNDFLMTRVSNFFFDIMVVAGIAAIRLSLLENYWGIILIMGVVGLVSTYAYNLFIAKKLFPKYRDEQFLMMYGMLTGTASTGVILLREIDEEFKTPASDNLVYQNFPAIVFGFPMMLLATFAPKQPILSLLIVIAFFAVMNVILFRSFIFKKKK